MPKRNSRATTTQLQAHITALELLVQQLVFLMEVEPAPTAEKVAAWLMACHSRQQAANTADPRALAAFAALTRKVLELKK